MNARGGDQDPESGSWSSSGEIISRLVSSLPGGDCAGGDGCVRSRNNARIWRCFLVSEAALHFHRPMNLNPATPPWRSPMFRMVIRARSGEPLASGSSLPGEDWRQTLMRIAQTHVGDGIARD